jgi:hypothetical protein
MRKRLVAWLYWRSVPWNNRPPFRVYWRTVKDLQRRREEP